MNLHTTFLWKGILKSFKKAGVIYKVVYKIGYKNFDRFFGEFSFSFCALIQMVSSDILQVFSI